MFFLCAKITAVESTQLKTNNQKEETLKAKNSNIGKEIEAIIAPSETY